MPGSYEQTTVTEETIVNPETVTEDIISENPEENPEIDPENPEVTEEEQEAARSFIEENYEDVECEVHVGKQPVYSFIVGVE